MLRTWTIGIVLAFAVSAGLGEVTTLTYPCSRDTGCYQTGGQFHVNTGAMPYLRAGKGDHNAGEQVIVDWDMVAVQSGIAADLAARGKTLQQAMDLDMITVRYEVSGMNYGSDFPNKVVHLITVQSMNDWYEGDGIDWDANYDWTTPYAATAAYAGDTVPFSDLAISWLSPGGWLNMELKHTGAYSTPNSQDVVGFANVVDSNSSGTIDPEEITWTGADLDEAFWYELIYDDNCVGIRHYGDGWWPGLDINGNPIDPTRPVSDDNCMMPTREHWGGIATPRLVVTIVPEPATLSLLALGGLAALIRRRRG